MKITLNHIESQEYTDKIANVISSLPPKIYFFRDFFKSQATPPRIARKFYEDVKSNVFPNVFLVGNTSEEGYIITKQK